MVRPYGPLLATTPAGLIEERAAGVHPHARMHVPVEAATQARDRVAELNADGCVAVGGGSAIGLGKAVALRHGLPIIAVPTTYAGSEMTPVRGLTKDGVKRTGKDTRVLPVSVLYDPELTVTLPAIVSATSGMNAIAHAVEALWMLRPSLAVLTSCMACGPRASVRVPAARGESVMRRSPRPASVLAGPGHAPRASLPRLDSAMAS